MTPAAPASDADLREFIIQILNAEDQRPVDTWRTAGVIASRLTGRETILRADLARLTERLATAEAALKPFVFGDATLETILWGKFPDDTPGTITVKVGNFRRARAALQHGTADGQGRDG